MGTVGQAGGYVRITQCAEAMAALEQRAAAIPDAAASDHQQSRSLCFRCVSQIQCKIFSGSESSVYVP